MTTLPALLLGLTLGVGLTLVATGVPPMRRITLAQRVEPYLGGRNTPSTLLADASVTPWPAWERLLVPGLRRGLVRLEPWLGNGAAVRRQLDRLGRSTTLLQYRVEQLGWAVAGAALAVALIALLTGRDGFPGLVPTALLCLAGAVSGALARDRRLTHQVAARTARIREEFPTVAELLALSVAAGEGTTAAIARVSRVGHGAFVQELQRVLADIRAGEPLIRALHAAADRVGLPEVDRFVAALSVAVERGTPLAPVLQAQAADAREAGRRALIEAGGRKEIAMMVPVVFLVLPISVLFALFPGFYGLTVSSP